jgi:predicted nucleotidyltransferase
MQTTSLVEILRVLQTNQCEFILVGGVAAVLNGAPIQTYDLDVVYSRNPENIERLLSALESLDAIFRLQPERRLKPSASHLTGSGHLNLITRNGPLDLLATLGRGLAYEDLLAHSSEMDIGVAALIRVLNLEMIIALKEELGGPKDQAVLPVLRQTLMERRKKAAN